MIKNQTNCLTCNSLSKIYIKTKHKNKEHTIKKSSANYDVFNLKENNKKKKQALIIIVFRKNIDL
uniref:Uncharacterized protein n=1 Tax=Lepeophtheirus salmonis TaxID=72036 RepID=A0A0K2TQA3_LEPSM